MFFSPLVQSVLKRNTMELSKDDKTFIAWYAKLWYISLIILVITLITGMTNYRLESGIIDRTYTISIVILIIILIIGTVWILTNTNILADKKELISLYNEQIGADKKEIILAYLPIYNIHRWYQEHNFEKPNLLLKEAILVWWIFIALGLFTTQRRTSTFLILIIIRVASLMGGMDIVSPQIKTFINKLFLKNPEELRWYIHGWCTHMYRRLVKTSQFKSLNDDIADSKQDFSLLYNVKLQNSVIIKTQYAIWILCSILLIRQSNRNLLERTKFIPLLIIFGRYVVMLFKWHHLPPLPIFKEITDLGVYMYEKIKKHSNSQ